MAKIPNTDAEYKVTGSRLTTELSPAGTGFRDVWEVTYQIMSGPATGQAGTVRVPAESYSAEVVKAAINEQARHVHNVASL